MSQNTVVYKLYCEGRNFSEIGREIGLTRERVRQICKKLDAAEWTAGLSSRAVRVLRSARLKTKEAVKAAIKGQQLVKFQYYGPATQKEICVWLGIPDPQPPKMKLPKRVREEYRMFGRLGALKAAQNRKLAQK